jgi:recombination DNA repair RAD52 pathway protein
MSLASTASLWTNENIQNQTKKRQPTMRRSTVKLRPYNDPTISEPEEYVSQAENFQNLQKKTPMSIEETHAAQETKSNKVNEILNKITSIENDGNKLADFVPLTNKPDISTERKLVSNDANKYELKRNLEPFELLPQTLQSSPGNAQYVANDMDINYLSNYQQTYEAPPVFQSHPPNHSRPYYANMGVGGNDNKMIEKINYMIHLLEDQHNEKTANITEEFILYVFLGVFVIFTVDSFTRVGKYVR